MLTRLLKIPVLIGLMSLPCACGKSVTARKTAAEKAGSGTLLNIVSVSEMSGTSEKSPGELAAMSQEEFIAQMIEMVETMIADLESGEGSFERPVNLDEFLAHLNEHLQRLKNDEEYQRQIYEDFKELINNPPELPDGFDGEPPVPDTSTEN